MGNIPRFSHITQVSGPKTVYPRAHKYIEITIIMTVLRLFIFFIGTVLLLPLFSVSAAEDNFSSVEERRIEKTILEERTKIRKEREEIGLRKKELKSLEEGVDKKLAEIDDKLVALRTLQNKIEELLKKKSAVEQKKIQNLAKIYGKMSPQKAALALTGLQKQLASDLLEQMKIKSAAKILDQLSKQKATEISTTYTTLQLE